MFRKLCLLAVGIAVLLSASPVLADGDFYVVAAGGGVGTKITSVPYTISNPGFYYLGSNLTYTGSGNAITISSHNATLDLMGFCLTGPGWVEGPATGIRFSISKMNVEIRNGSINGLATETAEQGGVGSEDSTNNIRVRAVFGYGQRQRRSHRLIWHKQRGSGLYGLQFGKMASGLPAIPCQEELGEWK